MLIRKKENHKHIFQYQAYKRKRAARKLMHTAVLLPFVMNSYLEMRADLKRYIVTIRLQNELELKIMI